MMSVVLGLISILLGSYGIYYWMNDFLIVIKGILPLSFVCGGLLTLLAGISSLRK